MERHSLDSTSSASSSGSSGHLPCSTSGSGGIRTELQDIDLWQTFTNSVRNEMIITKSGRKLFPVMRVKIRGLDPNKMYSVSMDFHQVSQSRYKYTDGGWTPAGKAEPQPTGSTYIHHKSPNYGRYWMKDILDFSKIKVSNKTSDDKIWLNSLHMYEPRIMISRVDPLAKDGEVLILQQRLEICSFMAVTSYQNEAVTGLKVKHNPFAKGFQDSRAFRARLEESAANGDLSSPPFMPINSQGLGTWNPDVLQAQNAFPANFPPVHHAQSHRFNPYARTVPSVLKHERGYSLDLTPPQVASSSATHPVQRRYQHANPYSTYTGTALGYAPKSYDSSYSYGSYAPIDLSSGNSTTHHHHAGGDLYSPTSASSSTQFTYGQDVTSYSQAAMYSAYYGAPVYNSPAVYNSPMYPVTGNAGRGVDYSSQALYSERAFNQQASSDSGSTSSGSPVDVTLQQTHEHLSSSGQNVMY